MKIDWWTLGFQTVNVAVLVWLLQHFFWRPVAAMIETRRVAARKALDEAQAKDAAATAALADIAATRAGFTKERDAILATAKKDAEAASAKTAAAAKTAADALQTAATAAIEAEKASAETLWNDRASRLAVDIAARLSARVDGPAVDAAFLDWLVRGIEDLPLSVRQAVIADGVTLEAVTAKPPPPGDEQRYREAIGKAFAGTPRIDFKVDPSLIAGMEIHGPHLSVGNSWRADLDIIQADLAHAKGH